MQRKPAHPEALQWDDVRLFLALCRASTVGEAARALGVDASTVSRRLVLLEEALSARLFERGRGGIAPTEAAEELMPVAEELEQTMLRFTRAAEGLERDPSGLVRVTCPPDLAEVVLVPVVAELLARHPALQVELSPSEAIMDLSRREADLALRTTRPLQGDLVVTRLTRVRWIVVASPQRSRALGTLRAWTDAPWLGWGERRAHLAASRWHAKHVRGVPPVLRSDSLRVQLAAASAGLGVALVPEPSVAHFGLAPVKLAPALRDAAAQWPEDELFLVTHRALRDVPRVRVLWELILDRLGSRRVRR